MAIKVIDSIPLSYGIALSGLFLSFDKKFKIETDNLGKRYLVGDCMIRAVNDKTKPVLEVKRIIMDYPIIIDRDPIIYLYLKIKSQFKQVIDC